MKLYISITVLLIWSISNVGAKTKITLATSAGENHEDVRLFENSPDLVTFFSKKGIFTVKKSDLSVESQKIVGYDPIAAQKEVTRKEVADEKYYKQQKIRQEEAAQKYKTDRLKKKEMDRLSAIAAAENARLAQIIHTRRLVEAQQRQAEAQQRSRALAQHQEQERAKSAQLEAEKRTQSALDDIQRKQRQLEWDLTQQQQQRNLDQWNRGF